MICLSVLIFVILAIIAVAVLFSQFQPTTSTTSHYEANVPCDNDDSECKEGALEGEVQLNL